MNTTSEIKLVSPPERAVSPLPWFRLALPFSERRLLLIMGDGFCLALATLIALGSRSLLEANGRFSWFGNAGLFFWLGLLVLGWLVLINLNEGYQLKTAGSLPASTRSIALALAEAGCVYLFLFFIFGNPPAPNGPVSQANLLLPGIGAPPRIIPVMFFMAGLLLLSLWRWSYIRLFSCSTWRRRALVVGAGKAGQTLVQDVHQSFVGYEIVGFIDDDPAKQNTLIKGVPVVGNRHDLISQIKRTGSNEVILAITGDIHNELFNVLLKCYEQGITIKPMPLFYEEVQGRVPVEHLGQKWFMSPFWGENSESYIYRLGKRVIDVTLALVGLTLLIPILPLIVLLIRLDSPGSVFYGQQRLGRAGKPFWIYKFRSMRNDAEKCGKAVWATESDPRITRAGKFLRKTRLDELPQLYNVLKGDMSIVGPRPERPEFIETLQKEIPFYRARLSVKPGLTGWAQVEYRYGNTVDDALRKSQYDLYYVRHRSLAFELQIMFKTIKVMLLFKGT